MTRIAAKRAENYLSLAFDSSCSEVEIRSCHSPTAFATDAGTSSLNQMLSIYSSSAAESKGAIIDVVGYSPSSDRFAITEREA